MLDLLTKYMIELDGTVLFHVPVPPITFGTHLFRRLAQTGKVGGVVVDGVKAAVERERRWGARR